MIYKNFIILNVHDQVGHKGVAVYRGGIQLSGVLDTVDKAKQFIDGMQLVG